MKTREEIEYEISKLAKVAEANSPVPMTVRIQAQNVCHTLSWVLNDDVSINQYNVIGGCCCFKETRDIDHGHNCAIGVDMCLQPNDEMAPQAVGKRDVYPHWVSWKENI